ncbi:MAG: transcriptional regulator, winged helix family, partial [Frankiales bacterium]|nr:transcriptional regulator, winged helix family [Frankiales bacterium]
ESLQAAHLALLRATGLATAAVTGAPTAPRSIGMTERLARRTNLRASLTSFLGREDELARLSGLLRAGRLATVVGPGGAGKTRLAGVAAAEWTEELTDGVWFVELAPVTDEANIAQAILGSLGVRANQVIERSSVDLQRMTAEDRLVEVLSPSECLLVIDNCEHLIDAVAKLADRLLALCPELRILATSREPLGIDGEALCLLSPLTLPPPGVGAQAALGYPAVQLLADRAAAVSAEFAVDESTVAAVVEIVRRLDGLPLAIELAAARLRVLPVSEVAARLTDRFRLLTGGSRASMPRHRTLRAVVEWSWELLTPPERLLAERLAIFPSGATIDSVVAICADERLRAAEISSLLDALVDKSLLRLVEADRPAAEGAVNSVGGPGQPGSGQPGSGQPGWGQPNSASGMRYRMLETIREYGAEKLSEHHEVRQVRLAHALHFAELVARAEPWLRRAEQLTWFNELNRERDNILAALRFLGESGLADQTIAMASSLGWYWTLLGNHGEAATWMGFALEVPGGTPGQERTLAECLHAISLMGTTFGDASEEELAESMAQIAVLRERLLEVDAQLSPMVSLLRSIMAFFAGDDEGLTRLLEESLREGDPWVQAASLMFRAHFWENKGEVERMVADAEKSFELFTAIGDRWGLASTLSTLAMAHTLGGELDAAISEYEQAVRYLSQFGAVDDAAMMHLRLTDLQLRNGDLAAAKREAALARSTDFQSGSRAQRLLSDTALSAIAVVEGDVIAAAQYRQLLGDQLKQLGSRHPIDGHVRAIALAALGRLELLAGEADLAGASLLEAYQVGIETLDMPIVAGVAVAIARYAEFRGRAVDAAEILGAAARLRGSDDPTDVAVRSLSERLRQTLPEQFAVCYQRGKDLDRQAALARVDPSSLAVC